MSGSYTLIFDLDTYDGDDWLTYVFEDIAEDPALVSICSARPWSQDGFESLCNQWFTFDPATDPELDRRPLDARCGNLCYIVVTTDALPFSGTRPVPELYKDPSICCYFTPRRDKVVIPTGTPATFNVLSNDGTGVIVCCKTLTSHLQPAAGSVTCSEQGDCEFVAPEGWHGDVSFGYRTTAFISYSGPAQPASPVESVAFVDITVLPPPPVSEAAGLPGLLGALGFSIAVSRARRSRRQGRAPRMR